MRLNGCIRIFIVFLFLLPGCAVSDVGRDIKTSVYTLRGVKLVPYYSNNLYDFYYDAQSVRTRGDQYVTVTSIMFPKNEESRKARIKEMQDKGYWKAPLAYANYSHTALTYEIDCANRLARNISVIDFANNDILYKELDVFSWKRYVSEESDLDSLSHTLCP